MLPIFPKKFVRELRDFSTVSGDGCQSKRRGRAFILTIPDISEGPGWSLKRVIIRR